MAASLALIIPRSCPLPIRLIRLSGAMSTAPTARVVTLGGCQFGYMEHTAVIKWCFKCRITW
jgi:hypothetical protein